MWSADAISFRLLDDASADPVGMVEVVTPIGTLLVMAEPRIVGRTFFAERLHRHGVGFGANAIGPAALRLLAERFLRVIERLPGEARRALAQAG